MEVAAAAALEPKRHPQHLKGFQANCQSRFSSVSESHMRPTRVQKFDLTCAAFFSQGFVTTMNIA